METVNIHRAKTHLSRLVERAAAGEPFIIAKAGRPMVKVVPVGTQDTVPRLGFMVGDIDVPDDFDRMGDDAIAGMFEGDRSSEGDRSTGRDR